jgi:glutathione-regulated potassium-efflux system ancillary protein KefC
MGRIGGGAYQRLVSHHGMSVLGAENDPETLQVHQAASRQVSERGAVNSDFWDKLRICESLKLVLLTMPSHAGNVHALSQLKHRSFASHIVDIVKYADEVELLQGLGLTRSSSLTLKSTAH